MTVPSSAVVGRLLSGVWGEVSLGRAEHIAPWSVARWPVIGGPVESVIVKWLRDGDPEDPGARARPGQLSTEAHALKFLAEVGVRAPQLIAADDAILVMEDLAGYVPLYELIRREGYTDQTRRHLIEAARLLADRHGRTAPVANRYHREVLERNLVDRRADHLSMMRDAWTQVRQAATDLIGCPPSHDALAEAEEVQRCLSTPGTFCALSNGDSATNNVLVGQSESVVIDFEFAGYRHCLSDLAEFYLPGPRWVTVADARSTGFEEAYRTALSEAIPDVLDDVRFGNDLSAMALNHAFVRLANVTTIDARPPGDLSRLERRATIELAAALADSRDSFPALTCWCRRLGQTLRLRWPDVDTSHDHPTFLPRN